MVSSASVDVQSLGVTEVVVLVLLCVTCDELLMVTVGDEINLRGS
jgi:hypothetical protein